MLWVVAVPEAVTRGAPGFTAGVVWPLTSAGLAAGRVVAGPGLVDPLGAALPLGA